MGTRVPEKTGAPPMTSGVQETIVASYRHFRPKPLQQQTPRSRSHLVKTIFRHCTAPRLVRRMGFADAQPILQIGAMADSPKRLALAVSAAVVALAPAASAQQRPASFVDAATVVPGLVVD